MEISALNEKSVLHYSTPNKAQSLLWKLGKNSGRVRDSGHGAKQDLLSMVKLLYMETHRGCDLM